MTDAMIGRLISGTPRISSSKPPRRALDQQQVDRRPSAREDTVGGGSGQAIGGQDQRDRQAAPQAGFDVAERRNADAPAAATRRRSRSAKAYQCR